MRPDTDCANKKKKAAIHERKILTDRQLFSLKLLCLRCGQNFIIDQLIWRADEKMYQNKQKRIKTFHNKEKYTAHTANK